MKKIYSIVLLFLFIGAGLLIAQKQLYFGGQGTGYSTWVTDLNNFGRPDMDYVATFGGGGNLYVGFDFSKNFGLILMPGFQKLGQKSKDVLNDTTYARNVKLNYIQLPLMFKFRTSGEVGRFYVMLGPQFNFLMSANQTYYKNDISYEEQINNPLTGKMIKLGEETITDRYNSLDILARLDLGAEISLTDNLFINMGLSFAYGLTDINAPDYQIPNSSGTYNPSHNIAVGFNVGINYALDLSKSK